MENRKVERGCCQIVVTEIFIGDFKRCKMFYLYPVVGVKKIYHLLTFLILRIWHLFFALLSQFLFEAAFTITMHHGFIPVLAKIFSDVVFVGIILRHYHYLTKGL